MVDLLNVETPQINETDHVDAIREICGTDYAWLTRLDYIYGAVAVAERERWPLLGVSTTRRSMNLLCRRYNDETIACVSCFICGQLRTTCEGYPAVDLEKSVESTPFRQREIYFKGMKEIIAVERRSPGTLLNNCGYTLWRRRYKMPSTEPVSQPLSACGKRRDQHISRWALRLPIFDRACVLFGCTEDVACSGGHAEEFEGEPFMRTLCSDCTVPFCNDCWLKLQDHMPDHPCRDGGTIPMSLCNDHHYGHVNRYIVENKVTWLECAASCMIWSTMLVYYLESPYGHLMDEVLGEPQARTHVKGNLFSFSMPWEDIEKCCQQAVEHATGPHKEALRQLEQELGLPHSEETLALLLNVHIVGGNKDLAVHLKGLTMRVSVLQELIEILRHSGYRGYEKDGVNAPDKVARRLDERYTQKYGHASFTPLAVLDAVTVKAKQKVSIVQDKVATPADALQPIIEWDRSARPHHIVAERSARSQANIHDNYKTVFSKFGDFNIQTGTAMANQHLPWYLGMAFPFTLPAAVGGYDVPQQPRWRRPADDEIPWPREFCNDWLSRLAPCPRPRFDEDGEPLVDPLLEMLGESPLGAASPRPRFNDDGEMVVDPVAEMPDVLPLCGDTKRLRFNDDGELVVDPGAGMLGALPLCGDTKASETAPARWLKEQTIGPACKVQLFDLTRGLPQRIEGQYRRHWGFTPALWNLYFRERINLGANLSVKRNAADGPAGTDCETDAAMAAADLLEKLEKGYYLDRGKRRRINGDFSKLLFAEKITKLQKRLLCDFRFRCKAVSGTQEIRTKIGHIGFWAGVVYGNGIFMTISPSERHNYLAVRLSRYRMDDPCVAESREWAGKDRPSLHATATDTFCFDIPGYDMRRILLAEDPLAACNAFFVQIRTILATILGLRMCPHCPHCAEKECPCQDALGSVAELIGGLAGRADAMFGAVECQKTTGSLHYHFFLFIQRLHQYATLKEIA